VERVIPAPFLNHFDRGSDEHTVRFRICDGNGMANPVTRNENYPCIGGNWVSGSVAYTYVT